MKFGGGGQTPEEIYNAVKDLPIYSKRAFKIDAGMEGFLESLVFTTKSDLRKHFPNGFLRKSELLTNLVESKRVEVVRTSGTSAERLQVLWDTTWWDHHERKALCTNPIIQPFINSDYREAILTTPLCSDSVCKTGPLKMEDRIIDYMLFLNTQEDPTRWTATHLNQMEEELRRFQPIALEADPAYLAQFALFLEKSKLRPPRLHWIILTYELVSLIHRKIIRSVFNCPLFEFYGLTEAGVFFLECSKGRHHFCGQNSCVEILRPHSLAQCGKQLDETIGEIVVTTWGNKVEPLLRYRTSDLARVDPNPCDCGRNTPTLERFEGRITELIETKDGKLITPRAVDSALSKIKGILHYRCIEEPGSKLRIEYVKIEGSDPEDEIAQALSPLFSGFKLSVHLQRFIAPTPSGKYRLLVPL